MCNFFDNLELYSPTNLRGQKEVGGRLMLHMMENTILNMYSQYATDANPVLSADFTQVPIPWRFMWGTDDMLCPKTE